MIRIFIISFLASVALLQADPIEMNHALIEGNISCSSNGKFPFKVEIHQVTLDKVIHKQKHYYGHYSDPREYVCSGVSISLNGREIKVPEAAYADLCYLQSISPPNPLENGRWMVRIDGGSGGESYMVELVFSETKLLERRFAFTESQQEKIIDVRKF